MKKYWVYVHTCNANGKKYVGITTKVKPEFRWGRNGERYQYNKHFYSAILKYGWDNFQHEVFEVGSEEEMYRKEIELISFYHSNDPEYGYNCSTGGECSGLGCKHSEESKKKVSEILKGRTFSEETRKKMSEAAKKRCSDPEVRKKLSEANKERYLDPEYRKKMSKAIKESHLDPEYRKKASEVRKGKPNPRKGKPQPRIKISLPDGTIIEISKQNLGKYYINKGRKFEYVS